MALKILLSARASGANVDYHVITLVQGVKNMTAQQGQQPYIVDFQLDSFANETARDAGKSRLDQRTYKVPTSQEQIDAGIKLSDLYNYVKANDAEFTNAENV